MLREPDACLMSHRASFGGGGTPEMWSVFLRDTLCEASGPAASRMGSLHRALASTYKTSFQHQHFVFRATASAPRHVEELAWARNLQPIDVRFLLRYDGKRIPVFRTNDGRVYVQEQRILKDLCDSVVEIACGAAHLLCRTGEGRVFAAGNTRKGQCGHYGSVGFIPFSRAQEVHIPYGSGERAVQIAAAGDSSMVLLNSGRVFVFGCNEHCQLGNSSLDAIEQPLLLCEGIENFPKMDSIHLSGTHAVLLSKSEPSKFISFGANQQGECVVSNARTVEFSPEWKSASLTVSPSSSSSSPSSAPLTSKIQRVLLYPGGTKLLMKHTSSHNSSSTALQNTSFTTIKLGNAVASSSGFWDYASQIGIHFDRTMPENLTFFNLFNDSLPYWCQCALKSILSLDSDHSTSREKSFARLSCVCCSSDELIVILSNSICVESHFPVLSEDQAASTNDTLVAASLTLRISSDPILVGFANLLDATTRLSFSDGTTAVIHRTEFVSILVHSRALATFLLLPRSTLDIMIDFVSGPAFRAVVAFLMGRLCRRSPGKGLWNHVLYTETASRSADSDVANGCLGMIDYTTVVDVLVLCEMFELPLLRSLCEDVLFSLLRYEDGQTLKRMDGGSMEQLFGLFWDFSCSQCLSLLVPGCSIPGLSSVADPRSSSCCDSPSSTNLSRNGAAPKSKKPFWKRALRFLWCVK
eukprot:ANDGO_02936.mRNA.1 ubiquitin protein ligase E3A